MNKTHQQLGFTLIELTIAIFVIALLLGSILVPLTMQVEQRQITETQKTMDDIRDALLGFATTNGYLPCPDTDNDGNENVNAATGKCITISPSIASGNLPWNSLGLTANSDAWGNRFRYVINDRYAWRTPLANLVSLSGGGTDVRVCASAGCGGTGIAVVATVISMGKNGYGATNSQSGTANPAPIGADEQENLDTDREVVSRTVSAAGSPAGEFDDMVISLSQFVLFNRMVAAGRLP